MIEEATDGNFDALVAKYPRLLVMAFNPWCDPCTAAKPIFKAVAAANELYGVQAAGLWAERAPAACDKLKGEATPTFLAVRAGRVVGRVEGLNVRKLQALARQLRATPKRRKKEPE